MNQPVAWRDVAERERPAAGRAAQGEQHEEHRRGADRRAPGDDRQGPDAGVVGEAGDRAERAEADGGEGDQAGAKPSGRSRRATEPSLAARPAQAPLPPPARRARRASSGPIVSVRSRSALCRSTSARTAAASA